MRADRWKWIWQFAGYTPAMVVVVVAFTLLSTSTTSVASSSQTIAIIYSDADAPSPAGFGRIIDGIESNPDVLIYRVQLDAAPLANSPARPSLKLALNTASDAIAVIYPDIGEPYRSVFSKIIEGIEDKTKSRVASIAVGSDVNTQDVANELRKQNIKVVIALGRHGLNVASTLNRDIGVVAGGVISAPEAEGRALSIKSLAPDPTLIFGHLKVFAPGVRRVFVVYNPQHNAWLMRLAREAAKAHDLELVTHEVQDLKAAVRNYQQILASADPKRDAIWLPQDPTSVEEASILPLVLQEAWNRSLVVFSSNLAHVRRGALFALYPNNVELGRNLANTALDYLASGDATVRGVSALREVLIAVNVRTANHLGITVSTQQQQRFDLIFPQP